MTTTSETTSDTDNKTDVIVKKKQNLRVVIYYAKKDDNFPKAGKYRLRRLQEAFPEHKGNQTRLFGVNKKADFMTTWAEIKTLSEQYLLKRIHIFGHGNQHNIYLNMEKLDLSDIRTLPKLEWATDGVMILHTCQSGRDDDEILGQEDGLEIKNPTCIAKELSKFQEIRVIGNRIKANFSLSKAERELPYDYPSDYYFFVDDVYLWGYKSGSKVEEIHGNDDEYPLVEDNKIWACRQFRKDDELPRDLNNIETDLYFI